MGVFFFFFFFFSSWVSWSAYCKIFLRLGEYGQYSSSDLNQLPPINHDSDCQIVSLNPSQISYFSSMCVCACSVVLTLCNAMDCSPPGSSCLWDFSGKNTGVACHFLPLIFFYMFTNLMGRNVSFNLPSPEYQ